MTVPRLTQHELQREAPPAPSALTIGVFDGVHLGHQHLLREIVSRSAARHLVPAVITFHPHPLTVLRPNTVPSYLTGVEQRMELIRGLGIEYVAPVTFTAELAQTTAEDFMRAVLDEMRMKLLVLGPTFSPIGRGREGTAERMHELGREMGFDVEQVDPFVAGDLVVSSTAVRRALATGDMAAVAGLLGRPYSLSGPVVRGNERGRSIGFPTANILVAPDRAKPPLGVYATRCKVREATYPSITNIGRRPTFDDGNDVSVETHIFDFDQDIYGETAEIDLVRFIRPEMKFTGIDALRDQISRDCAQAREALG